MKKQLLIGAVSLLSIFGAKAQVEDVSVIVTPTMSYNWFDGKSTIDDGVMWGVQAGFGFGKFVELTGVYERSLDMKQTFGKYEDDINDIFSDFSFEGRDVKVERMGGEFKANIPGKGFSPHILIGTGVQKFSKELEDGDKYKNENLYGVGGLGVKFNLGQRTTFNLEGRGYVYNMNPGSLLYDPNGSDAFNDWIDGQDSNTMYNWSVMAGLQFYLGGRDDDQLSEMDKAYLQRFSSGLSGLKFTFSPEAAYIDFNSNSPYRTTYLLGGNIGVDLTDFIGLRGYYLHATQDEKLSFDFDKMAVYGVDFVGRLNVARGITPFITIGGGYIRTSDNYEGRSLVSGDSGAFRTADNGYFAKGGVGLEIPVSQYVDLYGSANLMYTMDDKDESVADIVSKDELNRHTMYSVGLRFKFGKKADTQDKIDRAFDNRFAGERDEYESKIDELEKELKEAYDNNDIDEMTRIVEEKKSIEKERDNTGDNYIKLTPAELESLIDKVIDGVEKEEKPSVESRLDQLERMLLNMNYSQSPYYNQNNAQQPQSSSSSLSDLDSSDYDAVNQRLIEEIKKLNQQLEEQRGEIDALNRKQSATKSQTVTQTPVTGTETTDDGTFRVTGNSMNKGMSLFIGSGFGKATTFNIGVRGHYGFSSTPIIFMPELYFGMGGDNAFGVSANGILPIKISALDQVNVEPYVGLGLGANYIKSHFSLNPNVILGAAYKVGEGSVTFDYTARGAFKHNQIALGYRFRF